MPWRPPHTHHRELNLWYRENSATGNITRNPYQEASHSAIVRAEGFVSATISSLPVEQRNPELLRLATENYNWAIHTENWDKAKECLGVALVSLRRLGVTDDRLDPNQDGFVTSEEIAQNIANLQRAPQPDQPRPPALPRR